MSLHLLGSLIDKKDINEKVYILQGKRCDGKSIYKDCINRVLGQYSANTTDPQDMRIHLNMLKVVRDHLKHGGCEELLRECDKDIQLLEASFTELD